MVRTSKDGIETNPVSNANIGEFNSMNDHPIFMMNDSFDKDHNHVTCL